MTVHDVVLAGESDEPREEVVLDAAQIYPHV